MLSTLVIFFILHIIPVYANTFNAVLVGIKEYGDADIFCAEDDVASIKEKLLEYDCWEEANIDILTETEKSQEITKQMILDALNDMPTSSGNVNLFYFSGHGDPYDAGGNYGLRIYESGANTHINPSELQNALDGNGSFTNFCCFLDACYTGSTFCNGSMTKGVICGAASGPAYFGDKWVGEQYPWEEYSHYTYFLSQGLIDRVADPYNIVSAQELHQYACDEGTYHNNQTPVMDDNLGFQFNITGDPIRLTHSSTYNYYTSMYDALDDAVSGDIIDVYDQFDSEYVGLFVDSGITVKFNENVELEFVNNDYIDVLGMLYIYDNTYFGTSGYSWGGITIEANGRLTIGGATTIEYSYNGLEIYSDDVFFPGNDFVTIRNSDQGLYVANNSTSIQNVILENCSDGIWIDSSDPSIENVYIQSPANSTGISISGTSSNPTISYATIENGFCGIELDYNVDLTLAYSNVEDDNISGSRVIFNDYGIGLDIANRLNNFSFDAVNDYYALDNWANSVNVAGNWWGSDDDAAQYDAFSGYYSSWSSRSHSHNNGSGVQMKIAAPQFAENPFIRAQEIEFSGDFNTALDLYREIISESDNPLYRRKAIKSIMRVNDRCNLPYIELRGIINDEMADMDSWDIETMSWYRPSLDYLLIETKLREARQASGPEKEQLLLAAAVEFERTSEKYCDDPMEVEMLARIANIYGDMLNDTATAKLYADRAAAINPGQSILRSAYRSANERYDPREYDDIYAVTRDRSTPQPPFEPESETTEGTAEFVTVSPNPANPVSYISYSIAKPSHVKLDIYSITGQKVAALVDDYRDAGVHTATFDGSNLASGLFLYRFQSKSFSTTGRLMILK